MKRRKHMDDDEKLIEKLMALWVSDYKYWGLHESITELLKEVRTHDAQADAEQVRPPCYGEWEILPSCMKCRWHQECEQACKVPDAEQGEECNPQTMTRAGLEILVDQLTDDERQWKERAETAEANLKTE